MENKWKHASGTKSERKGKRKEEEDSKDRYQWKGNTYRKRGERGYRKTGSILKYGSR